MGTESLFPWWFGVVKVVVVTVEVSGALVTPVVRVAGLPAVWLCQTALPPFEIWFPRPQCVGPLISIG